MLDGLEIRRRHHARTDPHVIDGRVDPGEHGGQGVADLDRVLEEGLAMLRSDPGELAEGVLDLAAVPDAHRLDHVDLVDAGGLRGGLDVRGQVGERVVVGHESLWRG